MAIHIDPEGKEIQALKRVVRWRGREVLEVGCGDGRLTLRLAGLGARVLGVDPDRALIRLARRNVPAHLKGSVEYRAGSGGKLRDRPNAFDLVVFGWSL